MTKNLMTVAVVLALAVPGVAQAQDQKTVVGWTFVGAGGGLLLGAFNWSSSCDAGYTTHTFETDALSGQRETWCVHVDQFGSDVKRPTIYTAFKRPAMAWAGVASASVGTVVLLLPKKVQKVVQPIGVTVTADGWQATATFTFGGVR